uniref:Uncharacterized protein n=1 Tax=Crocodylus porosus TaxID=8502 RepID=A0A7M4EE70_CROPO
TEARAPASSSTSRTLFDAVFGLRRAMLLLTVSVLTYAADVMPAWNGSAACPRVCQCLSRDTVRCDRAGLRALPGEIATSTRALSLSSNFLRVLTTSMFRNLTALRSLWLDGNNLTFLHPGTFSTLSSLRELGLRRNARLTSLHANAFRGLLNLASLDLSFCNIFEIHPLVFSHLPSLEALDLGSNNMRRDSLKDLKTLYELNLRKNPIWIIQRDAFTALSGLGVLNLGHNRLSDLPNQLFKGLIQLKTLHLEANRITRKLTGCPSSPGPADESACTDSDASAASRLPAVSDALVPAVLAWCLGKDVGHIHLP